MPTHDEIADVLERAGGRVGGPKAWTQGFYFRCGDGVRPDCWCAVGAIAAETVNDRNLCGAAIYTLWRRVGIVTAWNDAPGRTQAEVVAKLREVAASERAKVAS